MKTASAVCCLALTAVVDVRAGTIVQNAERDVPGNADKAVTTVYAQDGQLRFERLKTGEKQPEHIVIFKNDALYILDSEHKTYRVMDRATLQRVGDRMNQMSQQMNDKLAQLPPERRAMVEQMMGKNAPGAGPKPPRAAPQFHSTGKSETVGGRSCRIWEAAPNEHSLWQHCVVAAGTIPGGDEVIAAAKKMMAVTEDLMSSANIPWAKAGLHNEWEGIRALDGYPVLTRRMRDGKLESESRLKSSKQGAIAADRFEVPKDYSLQEIRRQEMGGM